MKIYEKYSALSSSGVIVSSVGNVILHGSVGKVPGLDTVNIYDLKKGSRTKALEYTDNKSSSMLGSSISTMLEVGDFGLAVGYSDGKIVIFRENDHLVLQGHNASITRFCFDQANSRLFSGSKDTKIILWDLISESGIVKLQGHKDSISGLKLIDDVLFSSANDSLIKIWDLKTFNCIENVSTSRGSIGAIEVINDKYLVLGLEDASLKVYGIDSNILNLKKSQISGNTPKELLDADGNLVKSLVEIGNLERSSKEKVLNLKLLDNYLGVQGADSIIEFYKIRSEQELEKKLARRRKRNKDSTKPVTLEITDHIPKVAQLKVSAKTKSFDFELKEKEVSIFRVLVQLTNNTLEWHEMIIGKKESETRLLSEISWQGHRSDVRALALSSDDSLYASGSSNLVKIWNTESQECIHTFDSGYILCLAFLPGDRYVIAGTKTGDLELFDLSCGTMIEKIKAHEGSIWSLQIKPEKTGLVTGSQDKKVKFWDFRLLEENGVKRITVVPTQTLQMTDDVLSVRLSQDGKLLAVALLDCTVKIFYTDSLKFFLSLYGHKLPVVSIDISSDGLLIATASSDKSIKIWGLDFGDCHASLRAHEDSVMAIQFIFGTHLLLSVSKDKSAKIWDVDSREMIQKLARHFGEVWSLAVGKYGNFILTGSHDRSIRKWIKTSDQFILEEAREEELEEIYDKMDLDSKEPDLDSTKEISSVNLKTSETMKAGEKILLVLELSQEEVSGLEIYENNKNQLTPPTRNPLLLSFGSLEMTPSEIVLSVFQKIKPFQLEEALLMLPFTQVSNLLCHMKEWMKNPINLRLCAKVLNFLLKTHFHQLLSTRSCRPLLLEISNSFRSRLIKTKDTIGYNLAALEFISSELSFNF